MTAGVSEEAGEGVWLGSVFFFFWWTEVCVFIFMGVSNLYSLICKF